MTLVSAGVPWLPCGLQHSMVQVRFELERADLPAFEARLPCRLGPVSTAPVGFATVGTNDRTWYTPEAAARHRGCDYDSGGLLSASVLLDETVPARPVAYL